MPGVYLFIYFFQVMPEVINVFHSRNVGVLFSFCAQVGLFILGSVNVKLASDFLLTSVLSVAPCTEIVKPASNCLKFECNVKAL